MSRSESRDKKALARLWSSGNTSIKFESMKPRHAAALALVGWYLMVPPLESHWWERAGYRLGWTKEVSVWAAKEEPLSNWVILYNSFDSADKCVAVKSRNFTSSLANQDKTAYRQAIFDSSVAAQCIPTDDPRLKGN